MSTFCYFFYHFKIQNEPFDHIEFLSRIYGNKYTYKSVDKNVFRFISKFFSFVYRKAIGLLFVFYMVNRRGYYHCTTGSPNTNCYISSVRKHMKFLPQKWLFELTVKIFGINFMFSIIIYFRYFLKSKLIYRIMSTGWPIGTVPFYYILHYKKHLTPLY